MVVGDNGVLKQAQNAKIKTEKAKDEELRGLTAAEAAGNLEMTWHKEKGEDGEEIKVPVPAGFAVSQVEGENRVDDGLVIIDSNENEFVWISCGTWDETQKKYSTAKYDEVKNYVTTEWSKQSYGYTDKNWENPNEDIAKTSIEKYGGFYVARFEAGVPSNASFYVSPNGSSDGEEYKGKNGVSDADTDGLTTIQPDRIDENLKPVSKRYNQVWNCIYQTTAKTVSENMYKDNNTVNSYLISSNDWNYICGNIFVKEEILGEERITNSITCGNYKNNTTTDYTSLDCIWAKHKNNSGWKYATKYEKGSITSEARRSEENNYLELATGASDDFKVYNIYDMAGNVYELTVETASTGDSVWNVERGGSFFSTGEDRPVVAALSGTESTRKEVDVGFRVVLYVN